MTSDLISQLPLADYTQFHKGRSKSVHNYCNQTKERDHWSAVHLWPVTWPKNTLMFSFPQAVIITFPSFLLNINILLSKITQHIYPPMLDEILIAWSPTNQF